MKSPVRTVLLAAACLSVAAIPSIASAGAGDLDLTWSGCQANPCTSTPPVNGFDYDTNAIVRQPDGKLLVGGGYNRYDGDNTPGRLKRLTVAGTRDATWSPGAFGINGNVLAVIVDGSSVFAAGSIAGFYTGAPGTTYIRYGVVKLNLSNGTLDTTFTGCTAGAACGNSTGQPSGLDGQTNAIARDAYGLVAAGSFVNYDSLTAVNTKSRRGVARLNATTGTIDVTNWTCDGGFSASGGTMSVNAMVLQPDGKIVVGGNFNTYSGSGCTSGGGSVTRNYVARVNSDGSLDTTFAPTGTGLNGVVHSLALQSDGKIVVGGAFTQYNGSTANYITRLNADGTRDASFAPTGIGLSGIPYALAIQPSGRIFIGGAFSMYNAAQCGRLARLESNGALDTSFACRTGATGFDGQVNALDFDSATGDLYAAGAFTNFGTDRRNRIARLNGLAPPGAPQSPTAVAGEGNATVSWSAPASNGGSAITGYAVTAAPGGATCTPSPATATSCVVSGLTAGTAYTFTVTATNAIGSSSASAATAPVTPTAAPVTPVAPDSGSSAENATGGGGSGSGGSGTTAKLRLGRVSSSVGLTSATVALRAVVNGPGRLRLGVTRSSTSQEASWSRVTLGATSAACSDVVRARRAGTYTLSCSLGAATRLALQSGSVAVRVAVTFTPSGGGASVTRTEVVRIAKARATGGGAVTG